MPQNQRQDGLTHRALLLRPSFFFWCSSDVVTIWCITCSLPLIFNYLTKPEYLYLRNLDAASARTTIHAEPFRDGNCCAKYSPMAAISGRSASPPPFKEWFVPNGGVRAGERNQRGRHGPLRRNSPGTRRCDGSRI